MLKKLKSRKLWVTVVTQVLVILIVGVSDLPIEQVETIVMGLVGAAGAFVIGQGIADSKKS